MPNDQQIHLWQRCGACGVNPIVGRRFECWTCPAGPNGNLCESCHARLSSGGLKHPPSTVVQQLPVPSGVHRFVAKEGQPEAIYEPWFEVSQPQVPDPAIPPAFVVRPEFCSGSDSVFGSFGFVAQWEGDARPLLLTALHVMDELIKYKGIDATCESTSYTGRELPTIVSEVKLYDVFAPTWILAELGSAGPMLVLPKARTHEEEPHCQGDIAAFWLGQPAGFSPSPLASHRPRVGEPIWQAVAVPGQSGPRALRGVTVLSDDDAFVFRYENFPAALEFMSGAPLLNEQGAIVGITVGAGDFRGAKFGHANPVESIREHLASA